MNHFNYLETAQETGKNHDVTREDARRGVLSSKKRQQRRNNHANREHQIYYTRV